MKWEKKIDMVKNINQGNYSKVTELILENIEEMDEQGWDMFFTGMSLTKEDIEPDIKDHKLIHEHTKSMQADSMVTAMRMALYETIVEEL